jgi:murein DD-endopeptidase MepM/ murein hydrolase activator NlpD
VIAARRLAALVCAALLWSLPAAAERPVVTWHPAKPQLGAVTWVHVQGAGSSATIEGALGPRTLTFFPYAGGQAAVVGIDLETKPGVEAWRLVVMEPGREARTLTGRVTIQRRDFPVQKLTLPTGMVDLDPETERRAVSEGERLRALYGTITPERLWHGHFVRPVAGHEPPSGFGARRIINGKPRAPHSGTDYAAERGTPVIAVNSGRVALVADFFFPGRLVVVDHGLGLYTMYFHLDTVAVTDGETVDRGQRLGTVGATGRATGPHLHFGAQLAGARIDPATLLSLDLRD